MDVVQSEPVDPSGPAFDALILAGGRAARIGGRSKPDVLVGGRRLLDHALDAAAGARLTVVVGPAALVAEAALVGALVLTTQEDPPHGGPVAGIEAGLRALDAAAHRADATAAPPVLLLACDVPLARHIVGRLLTLAFEAIALGLDGAHVIDRTGRSQPLLGAYRRGLLTTSLAGLTATGGTRDIAVRRLLAGARLREVLDDVGHAYDADTWEDVARLDALLDPGAWPATGR